MTREINEGVSELPVVAALRLLSVFTANQAGAYREHFEQVATVLGADIDTKLVTFVQGWASSNKDQVLVLTGNAGTGKTAAAESFCKTMNVSLPVNDGLEELVADNWLVKDLSGISTRRDRKKVMARVLRLPGKRLVCANEGVLRDALFDLEHNAANNLLDEALRHGAAEDDSMVILNVNRQRPTSSELWPRIMDYVSREELWHGCVDCPYDLGGCPMRANAEAYRNAEVREQLRTLFRIGSGEAVPTLREVLAILAWGLVGDNKCEEVRKSNRDRGPRAYHAGEAYYHRILGGGLDADGVERSPLLSAIRKARLGDVSDLEVDNWLRDPSDAPKAIRQIAADPAHDPTPSKGGGTALAGTRSPLDRVQTKQGIMTFFQLGEMVSTDEDPSKVEDGLDALVRGDQAVRPAGSLWRQRVFFEGVESLGGPDAAGFRLLDRRNATSLFRLAQEVESGADSTISIHQLVQGLNFLVTGFSSPDQGLIVPDSACLFSRDPGSFRPARPTFVHGTIALDRLSLNIPDRGLVREMLDVDSIDIDLIVDSDPELTLRISPRMYEAIREAADYQGPVGQGVAEMNSLRVFYGKLVAHIPGQLSEIKVADPGSSPPSLVPIRLPHFSGRDNG